MVQHNKRALSRDAGDPPSAFTLLLTSGVGTTQGEQEPENAFQCSHIRTLGSNGTEARLPWGCNGKQMVMNQGEFSKQIIFLKVGRNRHRAYKLKCWLKTCDIYRVTWA